MYHKKKLTEKSISRQFVFYQKVRIPQPHNLMVRQVS